MRYYRKVIKISAYDSPNVQRGLQQQRIGMVPTNDILLPGVLSWGEYSKRRATWDRVRQCIGLDGEFYEGPETLLFPPEWLNRAHDKARNLEGRKRQAKAMGIDPAEGGDKSVWAIVDEFGLMMLISMSTPDTSVITGQTIALMKQYAIPAEKVFFDRGGGGKQHADRLELQGYPVKSVGFGEAIVLEPKRGLRLLGETIDAREERYAYKNRRAEMYGILHQLLDPVNEGFGIPAEYTELRRQLAPLPKWHDEEGRMYLPPKQQKAGDRASLDKVTINSLIGCSPDEADALVLAVYGMTVKRTQTMAGAF